MSYLVDTNVLLRRAQPSHPLHGVAISRVATLLQKRRPLYFTPQNITEFWNVATRPGERNGMGLSQQLVLAEVADIEALFELLPDSRHIFPEWKRLVAEYGVVGSKVHDARLAAVALAYGVRHVLTFNTADFARFERLTVVHPSEI